MESEIINMSMRKFLKQVGVTSQYKIEEAIRHSSKEKKLDQQTFSIHMKLTAPEIGLDHSLTGEIILKEEK